MMKYRVLIFTSEEWRIPLWMTETDKWITLAAYSGDREQLVRPIMNTHSTAS
jgi:hypothetical protein